MPRGIYPRPSASTRFFRRVRKTPKCWIWEGGKFGYGCFWLQGKNVIAPRWAYEHLVGQIPPGKCVLHTCDNPACVRPAHLFLGTHADNMADMVRKGRKAVRRGEASKTSKLTAAKVRRIRKLAQTMSYAAVGKKYGVCPEHVGDIVRREYWRHVC